MQLMTPVVYFPLITTPIGWTSGDFDLEILPSIHRLVFQLEYGEDLDGKSRCYTCMGCMQVDPRGWSTSEFAPDKEIPVTAQIEMSEHSRLHGVIGAWARKEYGLK